MGAPRLHPSAGGSGAAERLKARKDRVISLWVERVRDEIPAAEKESPMIIVNTLPAVLDRLGEALSEGHPRATATQGSTMASEHGGERVRLTDFQIEDLVSEYKILREVLFDVLEEDGPLTPSERRTVNTSVDQAMMEACTGYSLVEATFRDQFFAIAAHDLRNPLGVARTSAELILIDPHSHTVPRLAERVVDNVGRVDRMLRDLLDAMRLDAGAAVQLDLEECDLVDVVRETLDQLDQGSAARVALQAPTPVRGYFARDPLRRAVENLVTNAIKYGSADTPVEVAVSETRGRALVMVHNDGEHIPADEQETLFHAFQRSAKAKQSGKEGWGLGLAQVRAVAEAHGGSISVDSLPGEGTTFIIDILVDARPYQRKPSAPPD